MIVEIKRSDRARAMRVAVHPGGQVRVTVPRRVTQIAIDRFIEKYAAWIQRQVKRAQGRIVIAGEKARIAEYKARAQQITDERCAYFARVYGVKHGKITIRAQKSRWGSCSRAGNLSFNYKIALLPWEIADYIIVHEICHLVALDHSKRFWALVERTVPQHRAIRRSLRGLAFRFS